MTDRLYFHDSCLTEFESAITGRFEDHQVIELARSAFYPTSGGQPHDTGTLNGIEVVDVYEDGDRLLHRLAAPLPEGNVVQGKVNWARRLDHMRQHTGQHLLSAVIEEQFGFKTVSFHLGAEAATIDVEPQDLHSDLLADIELAANERLLLDLPVAVSYEDSRFATGLRKPADREGLLRIVTIEGLDRSACGGTHVSRTGEVGLILLGRTEKVRKALRIEFYCAGRARHFLRSRLAKSEEDCAAAKERLAEADKQRRRLALEVAGAEGRRQYTVRVGGGRVTWVEEVPDLGEEARARLSAFLEGEGALGLFYVKQTAAMLVGAHPGLGLNCGELLKSVLADLGGKGGGSPKLAQGTLAAPEKLPEAIARFTS